MISKLAKAKDNWFFKIISAAVAVSFVSLFGVTGYISTASQNQTIVKVGKKKTTQSEFSYRLQRETAAFKNIAGDDTEITDEIRTALAENVLKQIIDENVMDQAMSKYDIHFPKAFVQQVIFRQPEFQNPLNGQFNPDIFRRYLSATGMSEADYVASVEHSMARKMLAADLVQTFAVPNVLSEAIHKMDNLRKSFKYTIVSPADVVIERKISDDEIKQYFADFGENFTVPEMRHAEVLYIPNEVILDKYANGEDMIRDYFNQHKKELDQPERRHILQMVFLNQETAEKAFEAVNSGKDFSETAKEFKAENADEPTLGIVAEDELAEDLSAPAFEMNVGEARLLQVADSWQVISVQEIIPAKEAVFEDVKDQIKKQLANENIYEAVREAKAAVDDAVNGGKTLEEAGSLFGIKPFPVENISEEKLAGGMPEAAGELSGTLDFNELVFSYGQDEISSSEEFDSGIAAVKVTKIQDAHLPEIADVKDEIITLWTVQEKNALAKEIADNITQDVEDGSELIKAAKARDLEAFRSEPVSRNETFAGLSKAEINELFMAEDGSVKVFERPGNVFVIATPFETVNYQNELTEDTLRNVRTRAILSLYTDMVRAALDSYAQDFNVKVNYKLAGFSE